MKELLLLRHAKSSRDDPALDDFDRPLAERGRRDASLMGRELAARDWLPDLTLVSPARRTRETWRLLSAEWTGIMPASEYPEALYEASAADLLARARQMEEATGMLLIVGHNPGLEDLARRLAGKGSNAKALQKLEEKFPTAALARFVFDGEWANLVFSGARLTHCVRPGDLR